MNKKYETDFTDYFAQLAHRDSKPLLFAVPTITGRAASKVDNILDYRDKKNVTNGKKTKKQSKSVYYASDLWCTQHDWRAMQRHFDIFFYDSEWKICVKDKKKFREAQLEFLRNPGKYQQKVIAYAT